jgi:predicted small integral membrane protein
MNETTPIAVGSIFRMSWGYDQTNVNFFQAVAVTPSGVKVKEIASKGVEGTEGFMCQNVVAVKDSFLSSSMWVDQAKGAFRRVTNGHFTFKGRYFVSLWDGKPTYCSWYA